MRFLSLCGCTATKTLKFIIRRTTLSSLMQGINVLPLKGQPRLLCFSPTNMAKAKTTSSGKKATAATKKSTSSRKKSTGKAYAKASRCWPGYEPVPGKSEHEEGSCRKKPASRNGGKTVNRETARKKQIKQGGKRAEQAHMKSPNASERRAHSKTASRKSASSTAK